MPTTKKRINLSVPSWMDKALQRLSKRDQMPQATKALQLIQKALELEEDKYLGKLADQRIDEASPFVSHEDAWS